jgi:hypothetical protein
MPVYSVIVGNLGTVYTGDKPRLAAHEWRHYVAQAKAGSGRVGGEPVTLTCDGKPVREYVPRRRVPTIKALSALVRAVKRNIDRDTYADEEDAWARGPNGISLTVGWRTDGEWSYQTGDNSFTGGAYGYPHWAVTSVYRRSNSRGIAADIQTQLRDAVY